MEPDQEDSNPVAHVHHYVLKGSGLSCWAECDGLVGPRLPTTEADGLLIFATMVCGEKLAGDNGPIVGSRSKVEKAMP